MNNKCWECNETIGLGVMTWEVPCKCGALNFVKVCGHCYMTSENTDPLVCKVCPRYLSILKNVRESVISIVNEKG